MFSNASLIFTRFSLPVLDDFTDKDNENIERIYKNVLMTTKSRAQQKALVKKYLGWVSRQPKKKVELFFFFFFFFLQFSFFFFFGGGGGSNVVSGNFGKNRRVWNMESKV